MGPLLLGMFLAFMANMLVNVMGGIVNGVAGAATGLSVGRHGSSAFNAFSPISIAVSGAGGIVTLVATSFFVAGITMFALKVARGVPYAFNDLFGATNVFVSVLLVNLITGIATAIGFVFLIVPGVIIGLGLSLAIPIVVDRGLGPIEALQESWKLTDGHKMNIFVFWLISFGLTIAGMCACGLGLLLAWPVIYLGQMYIYLRLSGQPVAAIGRNV